VIILIDGRSGSGKSRLARELAAKLDGAQVVSLDDIYPGWNGLAAASEAVAGILTSMRWQQWNWAENRAGAWHTLDPTRPIIVEGVGSISSTSRPLADRAIWLELDTAARKARALARDGELYAPHWESWAAQEELLLESENPRALADEIRRVDP